MKKTIYYLLILLISSTIISCKKSTSCGGLTCQNGSTCTSGKCECPAGYRGNSCEILTKNDLIGATYKGSCQGSCSTTEFCADSVYISDNTTGPTKFYIELTTSTGYHKVLANSTSYNSNNTEVNFEIPTQPYGASTVQGSGTYSINNNILLFNLNTYCGSFTLLRQ